MYPISNQLSNKFANMSFICMLLVVLIHCYIPSAKGSCFWWFTEIIGGGAWLTGGFVRCAVPWFFLLSGFLLAGHIAELGWWVAALKKRVMSLLVPYFFWSLVAAIPIFIYWIVFKQSFPELKFILKALGLQICGLPLMKQLWFLRCLFLCVVLSPLLVRGCSVRLLVILFMINFLYDLRLLPLGEFGYSFWGNMLSLSGLFYFALGIYLRLHSICLPKGLAFVIIFWIGSLSMLAAYAYCDFLGHWAKNIFKSLSIPFSLVALWCCVPVKRFSDKFIRNTFSVYCIHILAFVYARRLLPEDLDSRCSTYLFVVLAVVYSLMLFGSLAMAEAMRRVMPKTSRIAFGGR